MIAPTTWKEQGDGDRHGRWQKVAAGVLCSLPTSSPPREPRNRGQGTATAPPQGHFALSCESVLFFSQSSPLQGTSSVVCSALELSEVTQETLVSLLTRTVPSTQRSCEDDLCLCKDSADRGRRRGEAFWCLMSLNWQEGRCDQSWGPTKTPVGVLPMS